MAEKLKVNNLEHLFDHTWEIVPAGGATGEAFFAQHKEQKLFLKRNSSPFLAVLSAEGIVPKLVWTKRLENGDVITAQQWLDGHELTPKDMNETRVAKMLKKIHCSKPLLGMLERLGKTPLLPEMILEDIDGNVERELRSLPVAQKAIQFLNETIHDVQSDEKVVCHCDINHNNWLLAANNQLYLIDWDGAMIADPAIDLGLMLYWYIPTDQWEDWLNRYELTLTEDLKLRMKWYVISQTIISIQWYKSKNRTEEMKHWTNYLETIL